MRKLFFLIQFTNTGGYAGSRTYTEELKKVLSSLGYNPICVGIGTDKKKLHPPYDMYTDIISILALAKDNRCCIVYGNHREYEQAILEIGKNNSCPIIIHDPAEFGAYLKDYGSRVITLRKTNQMHLQNDNIQSTLLKMPHSFNIVKDVNKKKKYLSMQRIDARKKQHLLFELCHNNTDIDIYGTINNDSRPYIFRILDKDYNYWKQYYKGEYNGTDKINFISQYQYYIDLTYCKNHGGFQYTNLECFAASTPIIINNKFYEQDIGKDNIDMVNCIAMKDVSGLIDLNIPSNTYKQIVDAGNSIASMHHINNVSKEYKEYLI